MNAPAEKHAALYIRVSTDAQREEGYSIEAQEEMLRGWCASRSISRYEMYIDGGFSGSNIERPEMARLITDIQGGKVSHVVVYKLDRLSRSQKDTLYLIEDVFNPAGVSFVSLCENMDTSTPIGRAMLGIMSAFAQLERETIRERTRMGMRERVKSGLWMGGGKVPFGYDYDRERGILVPNADAETVRQVYRLYLSGYSLADVARLLGLRYERLAEQILLRRTNTGVISWRGEEFRGAHEPIISEEIYRRAMNMRRSRSRAVSTAPRHLLAGFLVCGECGAKMRYQSWGRQGDKIYCYSQDSGKERLAPGGRCGNIRYDASEVERAVVGDIMALARRSPAREAEGEQEAQGGASELINRRIAEAERRLRRLYLLYAEQLDDHDTTLRASIAAARDELARLTALRDCEDKKSDAAEEKRSAAEALHTFEEAWELMDMRERRALLSRIIERIVLRPGKIDIHYI